MTRFVLSFCRVPLFAAMLAFFKPISTADALSQQAQIAQADAALVPQRASPPPKRAPGRLRKLPSATDALAAAAAAAAAEAKAEDGSGAEEEETESKKKRGKYCNW